VKTGKQIAGCVQMSRNHVIHGAPKYTNLAIFHCLVEEMSLVGDVALVIVLWRPALSSLAASVTALS